MQTMMMMMMSVIIIIIIILSPASKQIKARGELLLSMARRADEQTSR